MTRTVVRLLASGASAKGRSRPRNEDALLCDAEKGLFIVADGVGGKRAGEWASRAVVTVLPLLLNQHLGQAGRARPGEIKAALLYCLRTLSQQLREKSARYGAISGLGSTAVVLLVRNGAACLAYAGDSRAYLLRGKKLVQLSTDQTTATALVQGGMLTPVAAARSPLRHRLEEYVGKSSTLHPGAVTRRLLPGDRWLLCSDGVTKGLSHQQIRALLRGFADPASACREILRAALHADGTDDTTAVVVDWPRKAARDSARSRSWPVVASPGPLRVRHKDRSAARPRSGFREEIQHGTM